MKFAQYSAVQVVVDLRHKVITLAFHLVHAGPTSASNCAWPH